MLTEEQTGRVDWPPGGCDVRTHHVDDLQQRHAQLHHDGRGVVEDRPLQPIVILHQFLVEFPLVLTLQRICQAMGQPEDRQSEPYSRHCVKIQVSPKLRTEVPFPKSVFKLDF